MEAQAGTKLVFSDILNGGMRVCYIEDGHYYIHHHKRSGPDSLYYKETTESPSKNDGPRGPHDPAESIGSRIGIYGSWDEAISATEDHYLQYRK